MDVERALKIVKYPLMSEKAFKLITMQNTLVFIVEGSASKRSIKEAIEILYKVKVKSINTVNTKGGKKAYVTLFREFSALDLATTLGLM